MDVQRLERDTPLRIKFASINENGNLFPDAHEEYDDIFPNQTTQLEEGWIATRSNDIEARDGSSGHKAWTLTHDKDKISIGAVAHETGIEFLIDYLREVAVGVATTAITSLMNSMWNKWRASRKLPGKNKIESTYVIEAEKVLPDGSKKLIKENIAGGAVTTEQIHMHMANALSQLSKLSNK